MQEIVGNAEEVQRVITAVEGASLLIDDVDNSLGLLDLKLKHMRADITAIESRNNSLQVWPGAVQLVVSQTGPSHSSPGWEAARQAHSWQAALCLCQPFLMLKQSCCVQVAARNQGALGAQLQDLLQRMHLDAATLQTLQAHEFSPAG